jgi:two-component system, chemotaxis family, chemotaxis protein CheY
MSSTVLVVDDTKFARLQIRRILEEAGYEIIEAANGADALKQYAKHSPNLITLDVTMPDMSGIEVLGMIMEKDATAKVVIVSASAISGNVREAITLGAVDFIVKPIDKDRVLDTIFKHCPPV